MEFRILDLFCGAGGFSYGMHKNEHFKTVVAVDFNVQAANTFERNMPNACVIIGDITQTVIQKQIISESKKRKVNMIIGGPPCQGFSLKGKKLGLDDPRNFLFREYLNIVEALQPEVFVIENVKSLLSTAKGWFRDEILSFIRKLGYHVSYGVLNAKNFGVPQGRERAIFICSKNIKIPLPCGSNRIVTVRDAISDLSYLNSGEGQFEMNYINEPSSLYQIQMREGSSKLYNHVASKHSKVAIEKLQLIPPQCGKEHLPKELLGNQRFNTTWGRLSWDKISPTIDTRFDTPSNGTNSHPYLHRAITPREAARLQSFDDNFIFWGSKFYIRTQIGNAVPPLLGKSIADAIEKAYQRDSLFIEKSSLFENQIPVDCKKNNGIFYTDIKLASAIIDFLEIPISSSVIDPCCGTGAFIYTLKKFGIANIYGIELDNATAELCKKITGIETIFNLDSIGPDGGKTLKRINSEPFDYIVGNPPYVPLTNDIRLNSDFKFSSLVASSGKNLFIGAIYRAFELCKNNGTVSLIVPKNLLHIPSYSKIREYLLHKTTIVSIIELGIHFKAVRGEQIVLTCKNSIPKPNHTIQFYEYSNGVINYLSKFKQSCYDNEIIVFTSNDEPEIYFKLKKLRPLLADVCIEPIKRGRTKGNVVRGKNIRKFGIKEVNLKEYGGLIFVQNIFSAESGIIASYGSDLSAGETITVINVSNSIFAKYILGLLHSRLINYYLIRFVFNNSRLTIHTDAKYLNNLPIISDTMYFNEVLWLVEKLENIEYMSQEWLELYENLNDLVFKIYDISDIDKKYINTEMSKIYSSKWYPLQNNYNCEF